ncbi:MAG: hypothetical protein GWN00_05265, partial [Aliifodinibius sp.]|nr:hypothetical protein [Fodinibius sp.]NIV14767.1 hypothetical protein [Fodinibius sp.]NIY24239.1 hypothetical protein [Fodinibius sp.]
AIDIFNNRKLRLDGVHFFIEMWGYNRADGRALGMLYDNDLSPLGWVFIPSPIRREIRYYSPNDESYHTTNLRDFKVGTEYDEQSDSMKEIYVSPFEFVMEFYERGKKEDFVERLMSQSSKASWFQFCDVIEAHEDFPAYCTSKTNLETLVARELPSLTGEERKRIATELYIKQQERELTESITSITGKYFIDSDKFEF